MSCFRGGRDSPRAAARKVKAATGPTCGLGCFLCSSVAAPPSSGIRSPLFVVSEEEEARQRTAANLFCFHLYCFVNRKASLKILCGSPHLPFLSVSGLNCPNDMDLIWAYLARSQDGRLPEEGLGQSHLQLTECTSFNLRLNSYLLQYYQTLSQSSQPA